MMRFTRALMVIVSSALLLIQPSHATDIVESTVLAYDRVANIIVLKDKTMWPLDLLTTDLPVDLLAGDKIEIRYQSNEDDGIQTIHSIVRLK